MLLIFKALPRLQFLWLLWHPRYHFLNDAKEMNPLQRFRHTRISEGREQDY
ncbi:Hypothetical protein ABZS17G119_02129 [Kosakonia cowanii]